MIKLENKSKFEEEKLTREIRQQKKNIDADRDKKIYQC